MSFTAASLMTEEMSQLAAKAIELGEGLDGLSSGMVIRNRASSSDREFKELMLRLKTLTNDELAILAHGSIAAKKQLCLVAFGRTYSFFKDFVSEVIWPKLEVYSYQLEDRDFWSFFSSKELTHPELASLTDLTRNKIRQVLFKVLEQGGIMDGVDSKRIVMPFIDSSVRTVLGQNDWTDRRVLLDPGTSNLA